MSDRQGAKPRAALPVPISRIVDLQIASCLNVRAALLCTFLGSPWVAWASFSAVEYHMLAVVLLFICICTLLVMTKEPAAVIKP
jgi:hypothetical protein